MSERAVFALAWLCVLAFGALWIGAWWVFGWPVWLCAALAFVCGVSVMHAAEVRLRR